MNLPFELFLALKYLKFRRGHSWLGGLTTLIGIGGIAIGVAALITTLGVMNGFQKDIQKKIMGTQAHLFILKEMDPGEVRSVEAVLNKYPEIAAWAPFTAGQTILTFSGRSTGIWVKGIDPSREFKTNDLAQTLREGTWEGLKESGGILLGQELAKQLGIWIGSPVTLISPKSIATPVGLFPRMEPYIVRGLFASGYYEYDTSLAYIPLKSAQRFFNTQGRITGLSVRLAHWEQAERIAPKLQKELGFYYTVKTWSQMNQSLFSALKLEKTVMFLILSLIIVVAAFNIASNLFLLSLEKTKEIGILKALGASSSHIRNLFILEGTIMGGVGIVLGGALGLVLCWLIQKYPIVELPGDVYYLTRVPVWVRWSDTLWILVLGFVSAILSTLLPALRAAKIPPVEAIRYG